MAYRDFSNPGSDVPDFTTLLPAPPKLGRLERDVVMLARHDRLSSLQPAGRLARVGRRLFGLAGANRLADPRLEALRRFAVIEIRTGSAGNHEIGRLADAGFSEIEIAQARQIALRYYRPSRLSVFTLLSLVVGGLAWLGAFFWVRARLGDSVISAMIVAYLGLPVVAALNPGDRPE
jgi:hypothetical protein